jgi:hypothetical protein
MGIVNSIVLFLVFLVLSESDTLEDILARHFRSINQDGMNRISSLEISGKNFFYMDDSSFYDNKPYLSGTYLEIVVKNEIYYNLIEDKATGGTQSFDMEYCINGKEAWKRQNQDISDWEFGIADSLYISMMIGIEGPLYNWNRKGYYLEYLGKRKVEGKNYDCIHVSTPLGSSVYYYLHPGNGLIIWKSNYSEYDKTYKNQAFFYSDYRKVEGVYFPFYSESRSAYMNSTTYVVRKFDNIILNGKIPESRFERPIE